MIRELVLMLLVLVSFSPIAGAEGFTVGVYGDGTGTTCNVVDDQPGLLEVHLILYAPDEVTGIRMAAPKPACMADATWLSDTDAWGMIFGDSQTGFTCAFSCGTGRIWFMVVNYFGHGTTPPCCLYPVYPDPAAPSGQIEVADCTSQLVYYAVGQVGTVNGDSSCPCGYPVTVESKTWGAIKSLYTER